MIRRSRSILEWSHWKNRLPSRRSSGRVAVSSLLFAVWALLTPAPLHAGVAEEPGANVFAQYVPTVINSRNGLPENSVDSMAQSSDGYIWLGTEEGLVRYDGSHAKVFDRSTDPLLHDNFINSISASKDGSIWVGTRKGISHFAQGRFLSHLNSKDLRINRVFCDASNAVWVGTDAGLYTIGKDGLELLLFAGIPRTASISNFSPGRDGSLWVATSVGLWQIQHGVAVRHGRAEGLPDTDVTNVTSAEDGSLWLATPAELLRWQGTVLRRIRVDDLVPHSRIRCMLVDGVGKLWIGMQRDGLVLVHGDRISRYRSSDGLPGDSVLALQRDRDNNLWVGMNGAGAVRFHAGLFTTYGSREGLTDSSIFLARTARDGSVWTASVHRTIDHLLPNGRVEVIDAKDGLPPGILYSMFEDNDGSIWAGSDAGELLHVVGHHVEVFHNPEHAKDQLRAIARGPDGDLFLLYHAQFGLVRFRDGKFMVEARNIPGKPATAAVAADRSLWIGSDKGGVTHWNNGVLAMYGPRQGVPDILESIVVDTQGTVWVGSTPDGLMRIAANGLITRFTHENGLFDDTVGTITDDEHGWLWITSNKGIYKVRKQELRDVAEGRAKRIQSVAYGTPDGMRTSECNYDTSPSASLAPNGRVWFASPEGLVSILPSASTRRFSNPSAVIEGLLVDGKPSRALVAQQTTPGEHDVEFDFTAPDFAASERLNFRYKLAGFDHGWIDAGKRQQAFYTRLPPGNYTLLVQASDGDMWPDRSASISLVVPPHFWQTVWFRLLGFSVLMLAGWGGYEVRVLALRRSQRILQEQVVARTAELQEAMREAEMAQHELQELATRDSMTRLWNRRHIFSMLSNEANRAEREDLSLCVLLLDVDHFKQVNDICGHLAGDRVLQAVANVLIEQTRPYDCAGRYGGEEFLVILCNCSLENGLRRANMIREAIAGSSVEWNGNPISVTASFGAALHFPGKSIESVLDEADRALYRAKHTGRNRVCTLVAETAPVSTPNGRTDELLERSKERRAALRVQPLTTAWGFES